MRASKLLLLGVVVCYCITGLEAFGQQGGPQAVPPPGGSPVIIPPPDNPNSAYQLDYVIAEIENGKKVNTRSYRVLTDDGGEGNMHLGSKMPIAGEKGPMYLDVGLRIDCRVRPREGNNVWLSTRFELSNVVDQAPGTGLVAAGALPLRTIEWSDRTVVPLGKPVDLAGGDDLNSKRRFELSVTVTKLK